MKFCKFFKNIFTIFFIRDEIRENIANIRFYISDSEICGFVAVIHSPWQFTDQIDGILIYSFKWLLVSFGLWAILSNYDWWDKIKYLKRRESF